MRRIGFKVLRPDFTSPWAPSPIRYWRSTWTYAKDSAHPLYVFTNLQKALNYITDEEARGLVIYSCEYEPLAPDNRWWKQPITPESILPGYIEPPYSTALAYWVRLWGGTRLLF